MLRRGAGLAAATLCLMLAGPVRAGVPAMPPDAGHDPARSDVAPGQAGVEDRTNTPDANAPAAPSVAGVPPTWPDDRFHRVAMLALLEQLRAALLSENSATLTLEHWCGAHRIAADPRILAVPEPGRTAAPDARQRALLGIGATEPVAYRHVRLLCGTVVLSEADNWYVPSRLTPEMNRVLETTHTPFGKAIASLGFTRATLSSRLLWSPLPADWTDQAASGAGAHPLAIPDSLIENRALLHDRAGRPLALLNETYRAGILAFAPPSP